MWKPWSHLDFSSQRGYNDATPGANEPFRSLGHLRRRIRNRMSSSIPELSQLKSRMKSTWMAGDFGQIAHFTAGEAGEFRSSHRDRSTGQCAGCCVWDRKYGNSRRQDRRIRRGRRYFHESPGAGKKERRHGATRHPVRRRGCRRVAVSRPVVRCRAEHVWSDVCAATAKSGCRVIASVQARGSHRHGELDSRKAS